MTDDPLIDIPVARAIVAHHGRERGLRIIAALVDETDHEAATAAYDALGSKIERSISVDGRATIESVFALHEAVDPETGDTDWSRIMFWDNGGIVLHGLSIPATTAIALEGHPVDRVVEHPHVAGLIADEIDATPSPEGRPQLVMNLTGYTCAVSAVANHLPEN